MSCPLCGYDLHRYSVETKHGTRAEIYHCGQCDGTWFDGEQVHHLPHHEIVRITDMYIKTKRPHFTSHTFICPADHKKLVTFTTETVPQGVAFFHCIKCKGIWATQRTVDDLIHVEEKSHGQTDPDISPAHRYAMVFVPTLIFIFLFISTFYTIQHLQESQESTIKATELLKTAQITAISPTMVSVTFQTATPVQAYIQYRTSAIDVIQKPVSSEFTTRHEILLTDLKPETIYTYTITFTDQTGRTVTTPEGVFTTRVQ